MKLAIVRTANGALDTKKYNVQEIGLGKALLQKGVSVDVYSTFKDISEVLVYDTHEKEELKLIPIKGFAVKQVTYYPRLIEQVLSQNYDLIQVQDDSQLMNPFLHKAAKEKGIKTIVYQGMYENYKGLGAFYQKIYDFFLIDMLRKNSDVVFAKTTFAKNYLLEKSFKDIELLPVGLDFKTSAPFLSKEKRFLSFKENFKHMMLYVGVFEPRRDVVFLLELLKELKQKEPQRSVGLVLVGKGSDGIKIDAAIKKMGLMDHVLSFEAIPNNEMSFIYKGCDLFLLPSKYEIYGMVVLEALFNGMPVLSSKVAGPADVLKYDFLGTTLKMNKIDWFTYICKSLDSEFLQNSKYMKQRTEYIMKNFSWDNLADIYMDRIR